ncbi:hypothetical protein RCO27_07670 [Sphingosinicella sp. LHD-64]|uniref:hypothetical protein n=1 Tax=Sphingosinicella sp. LHD-64 TaxID=3072139 RepID=UPI00280ED76C|nr:hypothetical protein [Sphingosinicella sp. LHD-64]MDQ8756107.1 hypothetical protein [Sphingosinicella sp. LHD-64]
MAKQQTDGPGLAARLAIGGVAGVAATLVFASTVRRLQGGRANARDTLASSIRLGDFAYGAAFGAFLAATNPRLGRLTGALAGGGLWLAGEAGLLPRLTVRPATGAAPGSAVLLAGHLAWGWSAAEAIQRAADAHAAVRSTLSA